MSDQSEDFFKILGVTRNASQEEIKQRQRDLAKRLNPDTGTEPDEEKYKQVNAAAECLRNPVAREKYENKLEGEEREERRREETARKRKETAASQEFAASPNLAASSRE